MQGLLNYWERQVCETERRIMGFAITNLKGNYIWALFVHPEWEQKGIGKKLHELMLNWYVGQTKTTFGWEPRPGGEPKRFTTEKAGQQWAHTGG